MEETIRMQILMYFASLFYYFNALKFLNHIMGFYATQAEYLHNKINIIISLYLFLVWVLSFYGKGFTM